MPTSRIGRSRSARSSTNAPGSASAGLTTRSTTADRLTADLEDLVAVRGAPAMLRSNNAPEFISEAMSNWAGTRTALSSIPPDSPRRNGYVESFNSRIRNECLNINSFYSLLHAQAVIGD